MKYIKLMLIMIATLMFQSCVSKNLSDSDVVFKAVTKCKKPEISFVLNILLGNADKKSEITKIYPTYLA